MSANYFKDKVIVITGAASGIGEATALHLASLGAKVSLADVQEDSLKRVVEQISKSGGGTVISKVVDVRDRAQVEDWIQHTVSTFGKIHGAANIAGVIGKTFGQLSLAETDDEDWDFVMDVNLKGVLNCLRAEIPHLAEGASIVNAASVAGLLGFPQIGAYVASKHAVIGLTKTAAKELGPKGIRCNCFAPGAIKTPMLKQDQDMRDEKKIERVSRSHVPLQRDGEPMEVAKLLEWLLSDGSSFITGTVQVVDGGWTC